MPVPVSAKPPTHSVSKQQHQRSHSGALAPLPINTLTHSLPLPPPGPPPSYGTREEWISSLPGWRRNKPRRIWEEDDARTIMQQAFLPGLTNAANASVIKGPRAQACIPPKISHHHHHHHHPHLHRPYPQPFVSAARNDVDAADDDEMASSFEFDVESQWSGHSPSPLGSAMDVDAGDDRSSSHAAVALADRIAAAYSAPGAGRYDRGAFTPVFEAISPDHDDRADPGSSPLGPVTPFGEFVDRVTVGYDREPPFTYANIGAPPSFGESYAMPYVKSFQEPAAAPPAATATAAATATESTSVQSSAVTYKKVADPFADWMAAYVWKACTTGMSLPQRYLPRTQHELRYLPLPPPHLASSIRALLMSTLLQPSAIVLAVWYIVRLPVCFGCMDKRSDRPEETYFRTELLGMNEWRGVTEREAVDSDAAFRLVLLGCMLANKWLDDHTFSNKTWHTISGIPIQSLNRLEFYALSIFHHDLSVPSGAWIQWLDHILAYQAASSPIGPPQPISRPSSDPRAIIRRTVEHVLEVSTRLTTARACDNPRCKLSHVEPAFVSVEGRKSHADPMPLLELEIDLDEDGPLREEYMPKRRTSRASSERERNYERERERERERAVFDDWAVERALPPPAKWSPSADEPLLRTANDRGRQYVAVQAPPPAPLLQPTRTYAPWGGPVLAPAAAPKMQLPPIYAPPASSQHARSMSMSTSISGFMPPGFQPDPSAHHARSMSQQYLYACSDVRATTNSGVGNGIGNNNSGNNSSNGNGNRSYQEPYWPVGRNGGYSYQPFDNSSVSLLPPASWIRV